MNAITNVAVVTLTFQAAKAQAMTLAASTGLPYRVVREGDGWVALLPAWAQTVACARTGRTLVAKAKPVDRERLNAWLDRQAGGSTIADRNADRTALCEESGAYEAVDEAIEAFGPGIEAAEGRLDRRLAEDAKRVRWASVASTAKFASRGRAVAFAKAKGGKLKLVVTSQLVGYTRETAEGPQDVSWTIVRKAWTVAYTTKRIVEAPPAEEPVFLRPCQTRVEADDLFDGVVCPVELYPEYEW